jgi:hypothetical protein
VWLIGAASTGNDTVDTVFAILQVPVVGVSMILFAWLWASGRIVSKREYDRALESVTQERTERIKAQDALVNTLPTLALTNEALREATRAIDRAAYRAGEGR